VKVYPFKIQKETQQSLLVQHDTGDRFYDRLHQHPEMQLSLIVKGQGTYIIGDAIGTFKSGMFFLIGENVPHVFRVNTDNASKVHMHSVFFTKTSFGVHFFELPEMISINKLLKNSSLGLKIDVNSDLEIQFVQVQKKTSLTNLIHFLKVLEIFAQSDYVVLASVKKKSILSEFEGKRMDAVYQFILENYTKSISLDQMADIAAMSKPAFCRYFKQHTNKTFVSFLNALRIGEACRQLQQTKEAVQAIAYVCGYNNLTNFNRTFKSLKGVSPMQFRKQFTASFT
jgi:AraC-like DNA-binding protein